VNVRYFFVNNR